LAVGCGLPVGTTPQEMSADVCSMQVATLWLDASTAHLLN
jgi:hypothetical protein